LSDLQTTDKPFLQLACVFPDIHHIFETLDSPF
jgi:hypothetical protein